MAQTNPNSALNRCKRALSTRWSGQDYPGAEARFYWQHLAKDIAVFVLMPVMSVIIYKALDGSKKGPGRAPPRLVQRDLTHAENSKSQIIEFGLPHPTGSAGSGNLRVARRSPGTLVRLKLENVVETYTTAPVHAQIVDAGLGKSLIGGSLIGDAVPDPTYERISITFRYARDPSREGIAFSVAARALELDGTLGLVAGKKEGFTTRSVLGSAANTTQGMRVQTNSGDLKDILLHAFTTGLFEEAGTASRVEQARAQVLTLTPGAEFFAELTDFFPGAAK